MTPNKQLEVLLQQMSFRHVRTYCLSKMNTLNVTEFEHNHWQEVVNLIDTENN